MYLQKTNIKKLPSGVKRPVPPRRNVHLQNQSQFAQTEHWQGSVRVVYKGVSYSCINYCAF